MPKPNPVRPRRRLSRHEQRERALQKLDPEARRKELLAAETGTIIREAPLKIGLCYPNPYRVAMSSLGYQVITVSTVDPLCRVNASSARRPGGLPPPELATDSIERGRPLSEFDLLAFSVSYDLDIPGFFELELGGVPIEQRSRETRSTHPSRRTLNGLKRSALRPIH